MSIEDYKKSEKKRIANSIRKTNVKVLCIEDLYKSTYEGNAFDKGEKYEVVLMSYGQTIVLDNADREFDFTNIDNGHQHIFSDHFNIVQ